MKIEQISLHHLRMPLVAPFETSFGRIITRDCILLQVFSEGLIGYGECTADRDPGYTYETSGTAWHILKEFLIPALLHQEVNDAEDLQFKLSKIKGHAMAKAGLEMALWDMLAKKEGCSLRKLLGGTKDHVAVGVSIGLQKSSEKLITTVEKYLDEGYRRVKIKIKPGRDVDDARAVRQAFPNLPLQVDANSAYTLESAQTLLPLDNLDLLLIEQPLAEDDLWDHSRLQRQFRTAICLDESITSKRHARQALEMDACRIVNIKAGRVGGISQGKAIHDLCLSEDIPVWCGGMLETGVGRAANLALATLPNFKLPGDISATKRYYERDITEQIFTLNADSTISVPESQGLGVSLDLSAVAMFTVRNMVMR